MNIHVHINIDTLRSIYPPSLKSIVYREKEQILVKCLDDSFSGNIFVYIFIGWLMVPWAKKIANTCTPKVHMF